MNGSSVFDSVDSHSVFELVCELSHPLYGEDAATELHQRLRSEHLPRIDRNVNEKYRKTISAESVFDSAFVTLIRGFDSSVYTYQGWRQLNGLTEKIWRRKLGMRVRSERKHAETHSLPGQTESTAGEEGKYVPVQEMAPLTNVRRCTEPLQPIASSASSFTGDSVDYYLHAEAPVCRIAVREIIDSLPDDLQTFVKLYFIKGNPLGHTAAIMDISESKARWILNLVQRKFNQWHGDRDTC